MRRPENTTNSRKRIDHISTQSDEIISLIGHLNPNKATESDGISGQMILLIYTKPPVIHSELNQMSPYSSHLPYRALLTFLFHSWEPSPMTASFMLMTSSPIY